MNVRLLKVAQYLGANGFYKEASDLKKLAFGEEDAHDEERDEESVEEEEEEEEDLMEELSEFFFTAREMGLSPQSLIKHPDYRHLRDLFERLAEGE